MLTKFITSTEIGDTVLPVIEITGGTGPTIVIGSTTRTTENALLELFGTRGFLLPRLTDTQRNGLTMTANDVGLIVYQTNGDEGLYIYKSGGWVQII